MTEYLRLLGFDFGTKKIGVAYGQTLTGTAKPLGILVAEKGIPNWQEIQALLDQWQPNQLVVGLPLNMDATDQWITDEAKAFAKSLEERFGLPVAMMDERLTSAEARSLMFEQGGYKALKKQPIDAIAAVLILESWMRGYAKN